MNIVKETACEIILKGLQNHISVLTLNWRTELKSEINHDCKCLKSNDIH